MEDTNVAMITSMGFTQNAALRGLRRGGGDVERAVEWIMAHVDDADLNDPLPQSVHDPPSQPQVDGGVLPPTIVLASYYILDGTIYQAKCRSFCL